MTIKWITRSDWHISPLKIQNVSWHFDEKMNEPVVNKKYEYTIVFFAKKIVKNGTRYTIYVPNDLASYLIGTYGGYVDIEINAPTMYPKMPKEKKQK